MVVERVARQQRYSVKLWQFEMLSRFDGSQTFEGVAKEVYSLQPGGFTAMGLLSFYNWLYDEDLVLCECESVFELVGDQHDANEAVPAKLSTFVRQLLSDSRVIRGVKVMAAIIFSLSVFRLAFVTAPIFEPAADHLYAAVERVLRKPEASISHGELARAAEMSPVAKVELAAKVETASPTASSHEVAPGEAISGSTSSAEVAEVASVVSTRTESIEILRIQLEECRIRRDEFYLQNDEEGYRGEVHRMTNLAKEIGDIENRP